MLRHLVFGFSPQSARFSHKIVHVGFLVNKMTVGQDFLLALRISRAVYHSTNAP
jgi:hypothetical protein